MKLVVNTNVFIVGFLDLAERKESCEVQILRELKNRKHRLILSSNLEEQILRVARRVRSRDWVGLLRHVIWSDLEIKYAELNWELRRKYEDKVPRKDLGVFVTAIKGEADYLISNDEDFLEKASHAQQTFRCVTPSEFLEEEKKRTEKDRPA